LFKNATLYRIGPQWSASAQQIEAALQKVVFLPCGATQPQSMGWVPPRGVAHGPLVEAVAGQWLLKLMIESKVLPAAVVKRKVDERSAQIEAESGRKPGKRQARELKDEAVQTLLPMAFTKQAAVGVWIDPALRLLLVDAGSQGRADEVVSLLVQALDGLSATLLQTEMAPATARAGWLASGEPPPGFSIDRECELKSADEMKSVVRYARHMLDIDEVRLHIEGGKQPTRLALTWEGRVSFVLTDALQLRKLAFVDGVFESGTALRDGQDDRFDADAAIATEIGKLIPDLIDALGGEPDAIGADLAPPAARTVPPRVGEPA
jgi:recombination associated protein RdgC